MFGALLFLLPAIAVFATLLARRYPGERMVLRLRRRSAGRRALSRVPASPPRRPMLERSVARGTLLMGRSLAVRPPPRGAFAG